MTTEPSAWSPRKHILVRGIAASRLQGLFKWSFIGWALVLVLNVAAWMAPGLKVPLLSTAVPMMLACVAFYVVLSAAVYLQRNRELAAGYTTLRVGYRDVDQVDPRTGYVLRAAGEDVLSDEELEARLQEIHRRSV